ncbi:MAG TPA: hypothetical protein VLV49_14675 [Terriglobales bacterium]|nr:hypothetical protein [Terriglobales bacterium]
MKKTGLFLLLCLSLAAYGQDSDGPQGTVPNRVTFPVERVQTPTYADLYCAGFITDKLVPTTDYVAGGLETPNTTKNVNGDLVYLTGGKYQAGQEYTILRELHDPNRYELFPGQHKLLRASGQPYGEIGKVRVVDARNQMAVAQVEFSCDPVNPGDLAVPFVEKTPVSFHPPLRFDRFAPPNGKLSGRIVMAKDFDYELGTGAKVYMNVGSNQGVKIGDYFRAVRRYEADYTDPVDRLSFKAAIAEDTQSAPPSYDASFFTKTKGPNIHVADFPRRALGEIVILSTTPTTSTGMIVFSLNDIRAGDTVELDEQP